MSQRYFVGVDIGTTSTKAIVFSPTGEVKGMGNREYPLLVPQPGWAEQDPDVILQAVTIAVQDAVHQVNASEIAALGFSAAMHSLILLDDKGHPLTRSIIWADNRSLAQTDRLKQGGHAIYLRTGTPIHPMSPLTKLLWMREEAAHLFGQAAKFVSIKEYIFYRWLDRFVVDHSIAGASGLFNLEQLDWDQDVLDRVGIRRNQLSELVPTTQIFWGLKPQYAKAMGLDENTPIVIGASDGALANLGVGAIDPAQMAITIGTSSAVRAIVPQPKTDPKGRTFCYALTENHWVVGGASNNGGVILRWFRDGFCQAEVEQAKAANVDSYKLMIESANRVAAGAEGLICLPFWSGERAPYWNAQARGVFFGLGLHHDRSHLTRAILEGILFAVYSISLALRDLAGTAGEIRASGGFARSPIWRQMAADILGYELVVPAVTEGSSLGAAVLAMLATGTIDRLEAVQPLIQISDRHQPNLQLTDTYRKLFEIYDRLYQDNIESFAALGSHRSSSQS